MHRQGAEFRLESCTTGEPVHEERRLTVPPAPSVLQRQEAQDANAAAAPAAPSITAQRAKTKASANYSNSAWDLLDAVKDKKIDLATAKDEELPEDVRKIAPEKRAEFVAAKQKEREEVQARLRKLTADRDNYVATQEKENSKEKRLDEAVGGAVREQAARKSFVIQTKE